MPHPFAYEQSAPTNWLFQVWQRLGSARVSASSAQLVRKVFWVTAHSLWAWLVFARVLFKFDAFLFIYGQTITNSRFELWLLRRLGKRVVFIYVGSDSRPPYMDGGRFPGTVEDTLPAQRLLRAVTRKRKRRIQLHERYADYLVNSPASAQFHEKPYINWFAMGLPKELSVQPGPPREGDGKVRILHAPSNPLVKGSPQIIEIIGRLQEKGHLIELVKIQGMSNERVLEELANCDFVVDQLYADTPLAAFATEAAFLGRPAVVGGYFAAQVQEYVAEDDIPPSLFVTPDELEAAIERLILDPALRVELGERARRFVNERWNARVVAQRYQALLNGDVPAHWWCDPHVLRYVGGCGLPRERVQRLVASLLAQDPGDLHVSDKPELEEALRYLASGVSPDRKS
ncbi:glycosyltransferase [Pseudomonas sp. XS1P51]